MEENGNTREVVRKINSDLFCKTTGIAKKKKTESGKLKYYEVGYENYQNLPLTILE